MVNFTNFSFYDVISELLTRSFFEFLDENEKLPRAFLFFHGHILKFSRAFFPFHGHLFLEIISRSLFKIVRALFSLFFHGHLTWFHGLFFVIFHGHEKVSRGKKH